MEATFPTSHLIMKMGTHPPPQPASGIICFHPETRASGFCLGDGGYSRGWVVLPTVTKGKQSEVQSFGIPT